ncbi:MAG: 4Fe-4S dicluster domain-containing protein [Deltaproteobacteria bacterium]|jgi:Fe-S oxidoreductase|nr:4Fe-4S dicluster domain-containing protein [Deltaproteobacteria bacterium]
MELKILEQFESLCTREAPPACQSWCPVQVEAGAVASLVAAGKTDEARKTLERHMPLASLCARLCEGPCRAKCLRSGYDAGVNLPLLELHAVLRGRQTKPYPMPPTPHSAALLGSGLSALVAAYNLALKGHKAVVFSPAPIGGRLLAAAGGRITEEILAEALDTLAKLRVEFVGTPSEKPVPGPLADWLKDYKAVFLSLDDPAYDFSVLGFDLTGLVPDPVTREPVPGGADGPGDAGGSDDAGGPEGAGLGGLFLGPRSPDPPGFVWAMSAGKKAAASMDRLFQGVSPKSARDREASGPTRLAVDLKDAAPVPEVVPADPESPTPEEAAREAKRCLGCSCVSCLPNCPLLRSRKGYPKKYAREFYNNIITAFGIRHSNRHINSCAECGLCGQLCPNGADMGKFVALARRDMVSGNHMPVSAHEFALEDQVFSNSEEAAFIRPAPGRDWGHGDGGGGRGHVLFPGCQLAGSSPETVLALHAHLNACLPGGAGLWAGCCGAPGRWSGRPRLTSLTAGEIRSVWLECGSPRVILACPSCVLFFQAELPEIDIIGLWPVLDGLPTPGGHMAAGVPLVLHDPCSARLDASGQDAVRSVLGKIGQKFVEPLMTRRLTLCCGRGGLVGEANPAMADEYARERTKDSAGPIVAWCSVCRDRFRSLGHEALHPLDLLFPRARPEELMKSPPPGISASREGRRYFKRLALEKTYGERAEKEDGVGLKIDIPGSVLRDMEGRRILMTDVAAVLENAAKNGPAFVNQETGRRIANLRPRQVTFWVEYEERTDGSLLVCRAWCHRMDVPGTPGEGEESPASSEGFARGGGRV